MLCRKPEASLMKTQHLNSTLVYKTVSSVLCILCFSFLYAPRDQVREDLSPLPSPPCVAEETVECTWLIDRALPGCSAREEQVKEPQVEPSESPRIAQRL